MPRFAGEDAAVSRRVAWLLAAFCSCCSDPLDSGAREDPSSNASQAAPASLTPSGAQLCDGRAGPDRGPSYPNGYLVLWGPSTIDVADALGRNIYSPESQAATRAFYRRYNDIAESAGPALINERDAPGLTRAYVDAAELVKDVASARLPRLPLPPDAGVSSETGFALEDVAPALAIHIAFLIVAIDQDNDSFRQRINETLAESPSSSLTKRIIASEFAPDLLRWFGNVSLSGGSVRGMVLSYLLEGKSDAAERAMRALIYWGGDLSGRDYYYPYSRDSLRQALLRNDLRLDQIVLSARASVPRLDRCSDLYAYYVEWLDLRSRVAADRDLDQLGEQVLSQARQFRATTPEVLIGPRYSAALAASINRLEGATS